MTTAFALLTVIVVPLLVRAEPPSEQQKYSPLGLALPTANQQTYMSWELEVRWTELRPRLSCLEALVSHAPVVVALAIQP